MASSYSSSRIVYASLGDDLAAIVAKLQRRRGASVVLVANNCPALQSGESLETVRRKAIELELDLTLVCGDRAVRSAAGGLGIKAVNSLSAIHPESHLEGGAGSTLAGPSLTGRSPLRGPSTANAGPREPAASTTRTSSAGKSSGKRPGPRDGKPEPLTTLSPKDDRRFSRRSGARSALPIDRSLSRVLATATLIVVVLFFLWGAVYVVVPSAKVQLTPVQQRYSTELQLMADPQTGRLDAAAGTIPAQLIVIEETDELTVAASGTKDQPVGKAEGSVVLRNQISQSVVVPRGAVVLTNDNRRYVTSAQVTVPPTSATSGSFGQRRVGVIADEVGPIGNVEASAITHLEDQSLNQRLIVVNDLPIQGGALREATFVTEEDRLKLYEDLRQDLMHRVMTRLRDRMNVADDIFVQWDADVIVEQAEYDREVGQESDNVTLRMKVKLRGTAFSNSYLIKVAPVILGRIVDNQLDSYELQEDSVEIGVPNVIGITEGVVSLTLQAQGNVVSSWDLGEIRRALANSSQEEAENYLNSLAGVGGFTLELGPDWYDRMPRLWFRIAIEVVEPLQVAA